MANALDENVLAAKNAAKWWWRTLGSVVTGLSLFSLLVRYGALDLHGLVAIVHANYVALRDLFFWPIELLVQQFWPAWSIAEDFRDLLLGCSAFIAISTRTGVQVGSGVLSVVAFVLLGFCSVLIVASVFSDPSSGIAARLFGLFMGGLLFLMFAGPAAYEMDRRAAVAYAVNTVACLTVTAALLLLNSVA